MVMDVLLIAEGAFSESTIFSALLQHGAEDCRLVYAGDLTDAGEHLDRHHVDVIVLGLAVPTQEIAATIRQTLAIAPRVPLVVLTEVADESLVAQALQVGAQDYLTLSHIDSDGLFRALHRAIVRKSAELVLLGKKDRDRVTLNSIGDAVASTDCSGNITYLNFRAEELTGWT
jgi:DNA-binding NarL/FixJ family response regulator